MITIEEIKKHSANNKSEAIFDAITQKIDGRIPHRNIKVLYVLRELMGDKCKRYLEIGVHNGGSMAVAMQSQYKCEFYGIDMFEKIVQYAHLSYFKSDNLSRKRTTSNIIKCNIFKHQFEIIEGNSRSQSVIESTQNHSPFNLVFIDGDHVYDGVKADFNNYSTFVSRGGLVVFDDYHEKNHPQIVKFVDDINDSSWWKVGSIPNIFIMQKNYD